MRRLPPSDAPASPTGVEVARRDRRLGRIPSRSSVVNRSRHASTAMASHATRHELAARGVVLVTVVGMSGAATLQLLLTEQLGVFFGICFVLASLTAALTVRSDGFFTVGVLPPLLLVGALTVIATIQPSAIDAPGLADDAGLLQRVIAGIVSQAGPLVIGHGLAIGVLAVRICTAPD